MEEKSKTVTTISGKLVSENDCRFIDGDYYLIGDVNIENSGDCYYIESSNKYVRITSELLIYDHSERQYVYKNTSKTFRKGVVDFDSQGNHKIGYFSYDRLYLLPQVVINNNKYYAISDDIFKKQYKYREDLKSGIYYDVTKKNALDFTRIPFCDNNLKRSLSYSVDSDLIKTYTTSYKEGFKSKPNKYIDKYCSISEKFTFGLEFETTKGIVPERFCKKLGLVPLRDGSIDGLEYVTIPLAGKKGLQTVVEICDILNERVDNDKNCSLHLHLGNIPRTESYLLALYKILFLLQDDIFKLFAFHKKDNRNLRRKHYTKPLNYSDVMIYLNNSITTEAEIKNNFKYLFKYLSMGYEYDEYNSNLNDVHSHPSDPRGTSKWNIRSRYNWVNLIPIIFGNKQTVEFRIHNATFNKVDVLYHMLTCMSILDYVKNNEKDILANFKYYAQLRLNDVLLSSFGNSDIYNHLVTYNKDRINFINEELMRRNLFPNYKVFKSRSYYKYNSLNDTHSNWYAYNANEIARRQLEERVQFIAQLRDEITNNDFVEVPVANNNEEPLEL